MGHIWMPKAWPQSPPCSLFSQVCFGTSPFPSPRGYQHRAGKPSSQHAQDPSSLCILPEHSDTLMLRLMLGQDLPRTLTLASMWPVPARWPHRHLSPSGLGHMVFGHKREQDVA